MHPFTMPKWAIDRQLARKGVEHPNANMSPDRTALVVVDMQNTFMLEGVGHSPCREAITIVPNVNRLAAATRECGGLVVWVQTAEDPTWRTMNEHLRPERIGKRRDSLARGSKGYELHATLETRETDLFVEKLRYSAFLRESSGIASALSSRRVDHVLIAGTITNVCCESSARDAMMMNFTTTMISDANAAATDEEHAASLAGFYAIFGDVMTTEMTIECLHIGARANGIISA
jgi:ureidoacrylate peracid hydrolase